jgi:hypothetical protein
MKRRCKNCEYFDLRENIKAFKKEKSKNVRFCLQGKADIYQWIMV